MLIPLVLPPGVYHTGTEYASAGRWNLAKLMRWFNKDIMPFGGWERVAGGTLSGPGRGMLPWRPSSFARQMMVGTPDNLYVWDEDSFINVTPAGYAPGVVDGFDGPGYGFEGYGDGDYGVASGSPATQPTIWALDTWGSHAVALATHEGVVYEYANNGAPAQPVANAPTGRWAFVTEEGMLVVLGANGDMRLAMWSGQQNNTVWTPDPSNAAGDYPFQTPGTLVAGQRIRGGSLIWTTTDLWLMRFIGGTLVYNFTRVGRDCGLIAPLAAQVLPNGTAIWMGARGFYLWDGSQVRRLACELQDYIFQDINLTQAGKFASGQISTFGEVLFFYASADSETNNRCISYNVLENHWNIVDPDGTMPRGCWANADAFPLPFAVGENGLVYQHESGWSADGEPLIEARFAQSGPLELGNGDQVMEAVQMIPDDRTFGATQMHFIQRFTPHGAVTYRGPYEVTRPYTDIRVTARQVGIRLESLADEDFRIGRFRLEAAPGGGR